jgi:hypothetical protein
MNRKPYQAIIVTSTDLLVIQRLKDRAETLFPWVSELSKFGNGLYSFFIPPTGDVLKPDLDNFDQLRDEFIDWLRSEEPNVDWIEVNYGDSSMRDRVTRSSRIVGLADNLRHAVKLPLASLSGEHRAAGEKFTTISTAPHQSKLSEYITESIARRNASKIDIDMGGVPAKDLVDVLINDLVKIRNSSMSGAHTQVPIAKGAVKALNREQSNYTKLIDEAAAEIEQRLIAGGNIFNLGYKHYDHKNLLANTPAHKCESLLFRPTDGGIGTIVISSVCEKVITIREQDFVNAVVIIQWLTESDCWACGITASDIVEMQNLGALVYLHGEFGPTKNAAWIP